MVKIEPTMVLSVPGSGFKIPCYGVGSSRRLSVPHPGDAKIKHKSKKLAIESILGPVVF